MKSSDNNTNPHILLFWSLPSVSMIDLYKEKCNKLNQAMIKVKSVEIVTNKDNVLRLRKIGVEVGTFFGLANIKGSMKKMLLNINHIKTIIIL